MRYRLHTLLMVLLLSGLLVDCGRSKPAPKPLEVSPIYSLEVRLESGITSQAGLREKDDVTLSGFRVQVDNEQIIINGKKYGKLQSGDKVLIEKDGQVLVNANVREPW